jgi:hypothetical protein
MWSLAVVRFPFDCVESYNIDSDEEECHLHGFQNLLVNLGLLSGPHSSA